MVVIDESGAVVGIENNRLTIKCRDGLRSFPIETIDSITILGHSQMTTACIQHCLTYGIPVSFLSRGGKYFGYLQSTGHVNTFRQRRQCALYDEEFAMNLSRNIVMAKIKNQQVVLRRYEGEHKAELAEAEHMLVICENKARIAPKYDTLMGYEGQAAKAYFQGLAAVVDPDFHFSGRNRRPPKDEFNSLLSLGYSILMNELYAAIERKGMNPYFGFLHRDGEHHPTLASDMMEEWRAVIVDSTVMSLINGHEIHKHDFQFDDTDEGCYLTKEGLRIFLAKLDRKMQAHNRYLSYTDYAVSFRQGIDLQMDALARAVESGDADIYHPIRIR